jgi:hypothetical protein
MIILHDDRSTAGNFERAPVGGSIIHVLAVKVVILAVKVIASW